MTVLIHPHSHAPVLVLLSCCVVVIPLLCISRTTMRIHAADARGRVQVRFASRQNKAGASPRASERASEWSAVCVLHEQVPRHRTAGRTPHPSAPRSPCGCADWRGTLKEPSANEPRQPTLPISPTWAFHPTRNHTTGSATVSAGYSGRAEAHDSRQLCGHYDPVFTYRWTLDICATPGCVHGTSTLFTVRLSLIDSSTQV